MAAPRRCFEIYPPTGAGHNFVYELPEYTIGVLRDIIFGDGEGRSIAASAATTPPGSEATLDSNAPSRATSDAA